MSFSEDKERAERLLRDLSESEPKQPSAEVSNKSVIPNLARYEIKDRLGEGATAVVYRAWDRELKRPVALKVLRTFSSLSDLARRRFQREAEASAGLSHPNVVALYDAGECDGQPYLVMELVEGRTLHSVFLDGRASGRDRIALLEKAARGVAAAHAKDIVHRDLKPENILVTPQGEPKVGDFGLAHLDDPAGRLTRTGATLGTPLYMAPEQVKGSAHEISPRTDVYALGAMLYEILAGRPPHAGEILAEVYEKILQEEPALPRQAGAPSSPDFETVAMKALEKSPGARYPTALEFAEDLRRAMEGEPILARPSGSIERIVRRAKRSRRILVPVIAAIIVGLAIGMIATRPRKRIAATVEALQGNVILVGSSGRPFVQVGSTIAEGEGLETGEAPGRAVVRLPGGATLEAGPGTQLRASAGGAFTLASGTAMAESAGQTLLLSTPHAEIRSERGGFSITVDASWTRVQSKAGVVRVTRLRDARSTTLTPGQALSVTPEGGPLDPVQPAGRVLRVGSGKDFALPSDAATAAIDGAVVEIDAGLYENDVAVWKANGLTIRGVGGRARLKSAGKRALDRAVWVLSGRNTLIENVEFSQCPMALSFEAQLTLRNCAFLDCGRTLRGTDNPDSDLLIEHSEFGHNGIGSGHAANLDCPVQRSAVFRHCYFHQARSGHQITSHARSTYLLYSKVADEGVPSSMLLDIGGGAAYLVGNVLCRGSATSKNRFAINFGYPQPRYSESLLCVVNNTLVDETASNSLIGVGSGARALIVNNIFVGKVPVLQGTGELHNNLVGRDPLFLDPARGDYRLRPESPAIDAGTDPGTSGGYDLTPRFQYVHPAGSMMRPVRGPLDLGAFEFSP